MHSKVKTLSLGLVFVCFCPKLIGQVAKKYTISGYVKEQGSSELLIGITVSAPEKVAGTVTNTYGFYSLTLPESDSVTIEITTLGYLPHVYRIALHQNTELDVFLAPQSSDLQEVVVEAGRISHLSEDPQMSKIDIPISQIKDIPALMGEKDVLKVIQLMPGVQKGGEGNSGIYVRGGGPDQNLIILDDAPVYNAFHLFGFFSLFNGDALKSVELTKGGFPAQYGGRLSSVIAMNMKEGNKEKIHGAAGIGLLSSRLTLEGPIVKNKSSFLVSARRTYFDILAKPFLPQEVRGGYYFYDLNAKVNYEFSKKNKIYLSGYFGKDKFFAGESINGNNNEFGLQWGNATGTFRWNHLFNEKLFANASVIFSNYKFEIYSEQKQNNEDFKLSYSSGIRDIGVKYDIDYLPSPKHTLKFGFISTYHRFTPSAVVLTGANDFDFQTKVNTLESQESGIYVQDIFKPMPKLTLQAGIRLSNFITTKKVYTYPEPRFSGSYMLGKDLSVKGSYALMNQYIHLLSNTGIGLPTDLWVPSTQNIAPQRSNQVAAGFAKDFIERNFSVSLEGYYKKMDNIIGYKEGASFLLIEDPAKQDANSWEKNITIGQGWSYGAEFLLQRKFGKLTGWVGYTLSWTQFQFDSLNFGKKYYARYDRRHDISVVGIYKLSEKVTFSMTWVFGTGNAITMPNATYSAPAHTGIPSNQKNPNQYMGYGNSVTDYGEKNSFRMAPYHRMDLGVQFHKQLSWGGTRTWEISVYNVYNRYNPYFYFISNDYANGSSVGKLKQITLFPFLPSFSYNIKF